MENRKYIKVIGSVAGGLMVISLLWLIASRNATTAIEKNLKEEKLATEELLSEKLMLDKQILQFQEDLASHRDKNVENNERISTLIKKLEATEKEYALLSSKLNQLRRVRKQQLELIEQNNHLQKEAEASQSWSGSLESENRELQTTLAMLQERNKILVTELSKSKYLTFDQSQVGAVKGSNEKLTVKAGQTKKIKTELEISVALKDLSFRVLDAKGIPLSRNNGDIAINAMPTSDSYTASTVTSIESNKLRRVEVSYIPKVKLSPGVYTVEISSENLYVGSVKVQLK